MKNFQQNQLELNIESSHLKCRCCFNKFDEKNDKLLISESHVAVFRIIINVELKMDSGFSSFICRACDIRLRNLAQFVETFGNIQGKFNNFVDSVTNTSDVEIDESNNEFYDQSTIADTSSVMCMKSCFVRLERLDENSINHKGNDSLKSKETKKENISQKSVETSSIGWKKFCL